MGEAASERAASPGELAENAPPGPRGDGSGGGLGSRPRCRQPTTTSTTARCLSRFASDEEVLALAEETGLHGAGSICFLPLGTTRGLTPKITNSSSRSAAAPACR